MERRQFLKKLLASAAGFAAVVVPGAALAMPRGRPASPTSVAGVRRRTRRRTRRRIHRNMRLTSLPYGCSVTRVRGGVTYYYCGSIWYRPVYEGTTVVYIVEEIESGADTNVEFEEY